MSKTYAPARHRLHPCVPTGFCAAFYKGTHPWPRSIYTNLAKRMDQSIYCHAELVFSDGISGSATLADKPGGVRLKQINYSKGLDGWDFVVLDPALEPFARAWFEQHQGERYDLWGQIKFVTGVFGDYFNKPDAWWCTESIAAAMHRTQPGRWGPGGLSEVIADFRVPQPLNIDTIFKDLPA